MTVTEAMEVAIDRLGGQVRVAEICGTSHATVWQWKTRGRVPAEYAPLIEEATGVRCEDLCPSVKWGILRRPMADPTLGQIRRLAEQHNLKEDLGDIVNFVCALLYPDSNLKSCTSSSPQPLKDAT